MNSNMLNNIQMRQVCYMTETNFHDLLTEEQRNKFCLFFGRRVIDAYDTLDQAQEAQKNKFKNIYTALYIPK